MSFVLLTKEFARPPLELLTDAWICSIVVGFALSRLDLLTDAWIYSIAVEFAH